MEKLTRFSDLKAASGIQKLHTIMRRGEHWAETPIFGVGEAVEYQLFIARRTRGALFVDLSEKTTYHFVPQRFPRGANSFGEYRRELS